MNTTRISCNAKALLAVLTLGAAAVASADPVSMDFGFARISNNGPTDIANQLLLTVWAVDENSTTVNFKITNNIGITSNIAEIYFDAVGGLNDGSLGTASLTQNGTSFHLSNKLSPPDLSGGNSLALPFVTSFGVDSDTKGSSPNDGIDAAADWVNIAFILNTSYFANYGAVIDALSDPDADGLRVGLHVRSISTGYSDAFVNTPPPPQVPDSGTTAILLGAGLIALGLFRRKNA